jgi:hypothetical protein
MIDDLEEQDEFEENKLLQKYHKDSKHQLNHYKRSKNSEAITIVNKSFEGTSL